MKKKIISALLLTALLLQSIFISSAITPTTDEIVEKAVQIICSKEGTYSSVVVDDNGALSIGCLQWHATRALNLLKDIVNANPSNAKTILGNTLYNEILTSTAWTTRILTSDEATKIKELLSTDESKAAQDALLNKDVLAYVTHGQSLGITSPSALVYFADVENQCGSGGSARVFNAAQELSGGIVTLEFLHQAALEDKAAGISANRRKSVYDYCLLLGWDEVIITEAYEIWVVTAEPTLNIRSGPGTSYAKVSSYNTGVQIIVYEQTTVDNVAWGRTSVGWVCLDYCEFVSSHTPTQKTFSVTFDANGGNLDDKKLSSLKINAINAIRTADTLVIYTPEHGTTTGSNNYGGEVVVGSDGIAQNTPKYGINNSTIPSGGFVVSAHGAALTELCSAIKKGDYVAYNVSDMTLEAYKDRQSYIAANKKTATGAAIGILPTPEREGYVFKGWFDENGTEFTATTVVTAETDFKLTAKWTPISVTVMFENNGGSSNVSPTAKAETTANGVNIYRNTDMLVIYDNDRGTSTKTNKYGSEAAVNSAGIVTEIWEESATGTGDHAIPEDGFVISGHGKGSKWITSNISVGNRIEFNYDTLAISVFSGNVDVSVSITAVYGQALGTLPSPTKDGYTFEGWVSENGTKYTANTLSDFTKDTVLYASWKEIGSVSPDTDPAPVTIKGDIDGDGKITGIDVLYLMQEIRSPGCTGYTNTDVNEDGKVTGIDMLELALIIKSA